MGILQHLRASAQSGLTMPAALWRPALPVALALVLLGAQMVPSAMQASAITTATGGASLSTPAVTAMYGGLRPGCQGSPAPCTPRAR